MIYILLPAYNEEISIKPLFEKLHLFFSEEKKLAYKIIICDDGSSDNTVDEINKFIDSHPIKILTHKINRGLGETMRDLIEYAAEVSQDDDIIIRMDCDDTHEPKFIDGMIKKIEEGNDIVIASRFVDGGGTRGLKGYRHVISMLAQHFMRFFFPIKGLKEYSSGYRAFRAKSLKHAVKVYGNDFIQLKGLGFTGTLEKIVKFKMLNAKFAESPFELRYDQKVSDSKMIASITTMGYVIMVILYYWPFRGWKSKYKNIEKLNEK